MKSKNKRRPLHRVGSSDGFGTWIRTTTKLPVHGEWVLAVYRGVYPPRYVRYSHDGVNTHFGGCGGDTDGKGSQPATHWMRIPDVPSVKLTCGGPRP